MIINIFKSNHVSSRMEIGQSLWLNPGIINKGDDHKVMPSVPAGFWKIIHMQHHFPESSVSNKQRLNSFSLPQG